MTFSDLRKRSGFHSPASSPHTSGSLHSLIQLTMPTGMEEGVMVLQNSPLISVDSNVDNGPFLHGDGRYRLSRFGSYGEGERNRVVLSCHPRKHPNDGMETHRLLRVSMVSLFRKCGKMGTTLRAACVYVMLSRSAADSSTPLILARLYTEAISSRMRFWDSGCRAISQRNQFRVLAVVS